MNLVSVRCLVCAIKCHYYIKKKEKLSIPSCEEICKRNLYYIAMQSMRVIVTKTYNNKMLLYHKAIHINNIDTYKDLFIYIPNNIRTDKALREWLHYITWRKNFRIEYVAETPGILPSTTSILLKWIELKVPSNIFRKYH